MTRAGHPVEPRRQKQRRSPGHYRAGYKHGTKRGQQIDTSPRRSELGGGKPPRKDGCPLTLLLLPLLVLLLVVLPLLAGGKNHTGWRLGKRHVPKDQMEQDRNQGLEPKRKITKDIPDDEVDGYPLGRRTGKPKESK